MDLFTSIPKEAAAPSLAILTVSQLTRRVKDALERQIGSVWVQGEISNHRLQSSGHHYFTLKDAGAQLSCVLFKGSAQYVRTPLADGMLVQVFGEITVYEARGQYQMLVKKVQAAGQGALQAKFEELKRRLAAEGLFAAERKQDIPRFPRCVAIVTSPTGAALQDMLNVLRRRARYLRILVAPVRVQGAGAEHEIAAALRLLDNESGRSLPVIDTVVVARGGGSLEDLWCFNEEVVARAIFACHLPVISAVGHEIDFTIADFTADLRAPTPSAAAELLAPDRDELLASLARQGQRMERRVRQAVETWQRVIDLTARGPLQREADRVLLPWRQRLDGIEDSLQRMTRENLQTRAAAVLASQHLLELRTPERVMARRAAALQMLGERLSARAAAAIERLRSSLEKHAGLLRTLGPESTLERGFTLTLDAAGRVVRDAAQLHQGDAFQIRLHKGRVHGVVTKVEEQ